MLSGCETRNELVLTIWAPKRLYKCHRNPLTTFK